MSSKEAAQTLVDKLTDRFLVKGSPVFPSISFIGTHREEGDNYCVKIGLVGEPTEDLGLPREEDGIAIIHETGYSRFQALGGGEA